MGTTVKAIISLIKSAIYNDKSILPDNFNWEEAKEIITSQEIYGLAYFGLYNSGIEIPEWLKTDFYKQCALLTRLWFCGNEIMDIFKENGIDYVPLKGIVLKDLYPNPYMRYMSDIDILIREEDYIGKIQPLMLNMGFTELERGEHEYRWRKGVILIELHNKIIPSYNKDFYKVIGDGWEWLEDNEYAYYLTHFAKHYRDGGIGIKCLIDMEILADKFTDKGLKELHLEQFYENVKSTLDCWFRDKPYSEVESHITKTLFISGEYGNVERLKQSDILKKVNAAKGNTKKARLIDFIKTVFPPFAIMKNKFKFLKYAPFLLPLTWIFRILASPFRGNIKENYLHNKSITRDIQRYKEELNFVGLDFWF